MAQLFEPGSFYDNLDATVQALGASQPGAVWGLAHVSWDSLSDRDAFLATLTARGIGDVLSKEAGS
jgi:hypothetical protein